MLTVDRAYGGEAAEYARLLMTSSAGAPGRAYLRRRGLTPATAQAWGLGYCPRGYVPTAYRAVAGKLPPKARFWEKMHGRLTIPVHDASGEVVAVSGRAVEACPEESKYMHYAFPTSRTLFGLFINRRAVFDADLLILTEGQLDVVSAWQAGLRCVASCFGAHFAPQQLALAARFTSRVAVLFDDDEAGRTGAQASMKHCTVHGDLRVRIAGGVLGGHDLDEFIRGGGDWRALLDQLRSEGAPVDEDEALRRRLGLVDG